MMFIPSEAVFAEINGNYPDIIEHSRKNKIWITSPTTLMAVLETIQRVLRDRELSKNTQKILLELNKLETEFNRYEQRWSNFNTHLNQVRKDAEEISTTTQKITSKFKEINKTSTKEIVDSKDEEV